MSIRKRPHWWGISFGQGLTGSQGATAAEACRKSSAYRQKTPRLQTCLKCLKTGKKASESEHWARGRALRDMVRRKLGGGVAGRSRGTLQIRVRTLDFACERKTCIREVRIGRGLYLHFKRILFLFFPLPKSLSLQSLHLPYLYQNLGKVEKLLHSLVWYPDGVKHLHLWGVIG